MDKTLPNRKHFFLALKTTLVVFFAAFLLPCRLFAQSPVISYTSPYTFGLNGPATLSPISSNVAAPTGAYGSPVVLGSGLAFEVNGLALDAAGNVYVNNIPSTTGEIDKISADGSSTTVIGTGFSGQSANVAVDPSGNVFVADQSNLWEIPASGSPVSYGTPVIIDGGSFSRPFGIAVDLSGNIYVSDLAAGGVYKMANDGSNLTRIDNGLSNIAALTVDAAGNVYAVDFAAGVLYEIPASGSQVQLATGFSSPRGLAVDANGTVYIDDESLGGGGIYSVPAGGGTPVAVVSGLTSLVGVAIDASYNLYATLQGPGGISKMSPTGGYFISPALPAGLTINATSGVISGTPSTALAATNYLVSAYNASGGSTATVNISVVPPPAISYTSPQTYTAGTAITPLAPSSSGATVGAPAYNSALSTVFTGFGSPAGVAMDASGNIYVADKNNNDIIKIPAGGGSLTTITASLNAPMGVAVDALGNIYVADSQNGVVKKISADLSTVTPVGSGFTTPIGVALDPSGNLFIADIGSNIIYEISKTSGTQSTFASGFFTDLSGIATDAAGNVYATDEGAGTLFKFTSRSNMTLQYAGMFSFPTGVAVGPAGDIFVSDGNAEQVYEIPMGNSAPLAIGSGFGFPAGVVVDGAGNVYATDAGPEVLYKITPSGGYYINQTLPRGLKLNDTTGVISGTPKVVSPATNYTVTSYAGGAPGAATVNITVNSAQPPAISYSSPQTYTAGTVISPLSPTNTGGAVASIGYNDNLATLGSGFSSPEGTAVDNHGNVYVADNLNNLVKEIPAGGGTPVSIGGTGFSGPAAVAVDSTGNVYVADEGNQQIVEIPATDLSGGSNTTLASGFTAPNGVAVDALGNVFVTDEGTETVYEIAAGSGTASTVTSGFVELTGVAVDASDNLYIADGGASQVYKYPLNGGGLAPIASFFNYPTGVAVDAAGAVYVADQGPNVVYRIPGAGVNQFTIASELDNPYGISVDGAGNVYIADISDNAVLEDSPDGGYFINRPSPAGLSLNSFTGTISGTPTAASPATNYIVSAYNTGGVSQALINLTVSLPPPPTLSYTTPQVYTAGTAITPLEPTSTGVDAPAYNSTLSTVGSGFIAPVGVAVDALGNLYVADEGNTGITEILAGGGTTTIASGAFAAPLGVAVDAAGNIYVADGGTSGSYNGAVYKIPVTGGTPGMPVSLGNPGDFGTPAGVAVDAAGNVYVGDIGFGSVDEIPVSGGGTIFFHFTFGYPGGVAVDAAGNVYVADSGSGGPAAVYKITAGGGSRMRIGHGFNLPTGVAVDASGNIFVADLGNLRVTELPSGGGPQVAVNGFPSPYGIAADGAGDLYVTNVGIGTVMEAKPDGGYYINPALPAGLSFNSTSGIISGTPTAASPATNYTVNAYSYGGSASATLNITVNLPPVPVISYNSPNIYIIGTPITALSPTVTNGTVSAPAYSTGTLNVGPAFVSPAGVASDAAGNLYVADFTAGATATGPTETTITKIPADGSPSFTIGSGFNNPEGVAVDAAGNVYVGDTFNNSVEKIPFSGGSYGTPVIVASGLNYPVGVATDGAGNVYIADFGNNAVKKVPFRGGAYGTPVAIGSGFSGPDGVAVDAAGNVYVADTFNEAVKMISVSAPYGSPVTIGSGFVDPLAVAVDAGGNVFVADGVKGVFEIVAPVTGIGGPVTPVSIGGGFNAPGGVTADAAGNIYVADGGSTLIKQIKPTGGYYMGPFLPAGLSFDGTTGIISGTPAKASPATNYQVSAYNLGGSGQATVNIEVAANDATLALLQISGQTISPTFATATTNYTATVSNATASVKVEAFTNNAGATIKINNNAVTSGAPSPALPLNVGVNTITTVVTAQDGVTTKTYTITVTRLPSTNATLALLQIGGQTISPAFATGTTSYTSSVPNATASIKVEAFTNDPTANVSINGNAVASGAPSPSLPLSVGSNTITVIVTAQDGVTTDTYTITVTRAPSGNATLALLQISGQTISPTFATTTTSYTCTVANNITSVKAEAFLNDATGTIKINGYTVASGAPSPALPLNVGTNTITTVVTAQDGVTTDTYTITVTRLPSSNATLALLQLGSGQTISPAFATATTSYTSTVANNITSVKAEAFLNDATATIKINGYTVASGAPSPALPLSVGSNTITTVVTAQDGVTTKTYTITVTRLPSSNATLALLQLGSGQTISPAFATATTNYTSTVPNKLTSIRAEAFLNDPTATITINGYTVASGAPSPALPLSIGDNTITTVVTAQDGVTTDTYTITVTRLPSSNATLALLQIGGQTISPTFATATTSYTASVPNTVTSIRVEAFLNDHTATLTINGYAVASGAPSPPLTLNVGPNTITTVVTAQDGVTTDTYTIIVTQAAGGTAFRPENITGLTDSAAMANDGILVHQGVSPNGDGINDFLQIDGITQYPENHLMIVDRNGTLIYQAKGYDNTNRRFDGHSNINGKMQQPGTYFYVLDYTVNGTTKRNTGFLVLKY